MIEIIFKGIMKNTSLINLRFKQGEIAIGKTKS
jgi:hypothetical protein